MYLESDGGGGGGVTERSVYSELPVKNFFSGLDEKEEDKDTQVT